MEVDLSEVKIMWFTTQNRRGTLIEVAQLKEQDFNDDHMIFTAAGFQNEPRAECCLQIRDAYLDTGDYNVSYLHLR